MNLQSGRIFIPGDRSLEAPILIYGAGSRGRELLSLLRGAGAGDKVEGFLSSHENGVFEGMPMRRFSDIDDTSLAGRLVLVASAGYRDIVHNLMKRGIDNFAVLLDPGEPDAALRSCNEEALASLNTMRNPMPAREGSRLEKPGDIYCCTLSFTMIMTNYGLKHCCHMPDSMLYDDPEKIMERYLAIRAGMYEALDRDRGCYCERCVYLDRRPERPPVTGLVGALSLDFSKHCNFACAYCRTPKSTEKHTHPRAMEMLRYLLRENLLTPDCAFNWAGDGEPVLSAHFDETIRLFLESGRTGHVYTNASILSEYLLKGLEAGTVSLTSSLDSGTAKTFKAIKGVDMFEKVVANLKRYASHAKPGNVVLKYMLEPANASTTEADAFLDVCERIGSPYIVISKDIYSNADFSEVCIHLREHARRRGFECRQEAWVPW